MTESLKFLEHSALTIFYIVYCTSSQMSPCPLQRQGWQNFCPLEAPPKYPILQWSHLRPVVWSWQFAHTAFSSSGPLCPFNLAENSVKSGNWMCGQADSSSFVNKEVLFQTAWSKQMSVWLLQNSRHGLHLRPRRGLPTKNGLKKVNKMVKS